MYAMIGIIVALLVTAILYVCDLILTQRVYAAKSLLDQGLLGQAWLSWTGSMLVLCLFACGCVLIEPAAASSGIPALLAFLNGVSVRAEGWVR